MGRVCVCVCVCVYVREGGGLCKYQMRLIIGETQTLVKSLLVNAAVLHIHWDGPMLERILVPKAARLSPPPISWWEMSSACQGA